MLTCSIKYFIMLSKTIQEALNSQVQMEAESSQAYLAMASWAEIQPGLQGVTDFFYKQSDEERVHMLKLIRFVNERGGFVRLFRRLHNLSLLLNRSNLLLMNF